MAQLVPRKFHGLLTHSYLFPSLSVFVCSSFCQMKITFHNNDEVDLSPQMFLPPAICWPCYTILFLFWVMIRLSNEVSGMATENICLDITQLRVVLLLFKRYQ